MNIFALKGHKVICNTLNAGYEHHQEMARKYLELNKVYTIEKTEVDSAHTDVWLQEISMIKFNSAFFEDITAQSVEEDKRHPHYKRFQE